jgi:adenylate cyclase
MAENMTPEAVVMLLRQFHERMTSQIFACGGSVEKYIGDEIFAVFGVPEPNGDDATNSLRCAERMIAALHVWNGERTQQGEIPLAIGIGLNCGPAVIGDVGSKQSLSFTVIGDTVNTASRLQGLTRNLDTPLVAAEAIIQAINTARSPDAAELLVGLGDQGEHTLRGRSAPVRFWTWRNPR